MFVFHSDVVPQNLKKGSIFFREIKKLDGFFEPEEFFQDEKTGFPSKKVLCKACLSLITSRDEQFSKNGKEEHCFFNPQGVAFVLTCFRQAKGCEVYGEPSRQFTWFDGYEWNYVLCRNCMEHLGWFFQSQAGDSFFGLIVEKLIDEQKG